MEKVKTVLDRERLSSDYVSSKQDFGKVVAGYKALKPPVWKSVWFYGTAGLATIAIVTSVVLYNPNKDIVPVDFPQVAATTVIKEKRDKPEKPPKQSFLAVNNAPEVDREEQALSVPQNKVAQDQEMDTDAKEDKSDQEKVYVNRRQERKEPASNSFTNMFPNIEGVYNGSIPYQLMCSQKGIQVNNDLAIISFDLQYYNGRESIEKSIKGNVIPLDICENITKTSMNNNVFITNIKAEHRVSGRVTTLSSMNLMPTNP